MTTLSKTKPFKSSSSANSSALNSGNGLPILLNFYNRIIWNFPVLLEAATRLCGWLQLSANQARPIQAYCISIHNKYSLWKFPVLGHWFYCPNQLIFIYSKTHTHLYQYDKIQTHMIWFHLAVTTEGFYQSSNVGFENSQQNLIVPLIKIFWQPIP